MDPNSSMNLEEIIRRCVREEIHVREELGKRSHYNLPPQSLPLPDKNIQTRYQLQFINKVQHPTYTTKPVRDNNGDPIRVEIYDSYNRSRVPPYCSLSSAKVRIIVLDADFWKNRVNRSRSEFVQNELRGREGKEPILNGHGLTIRLENGVGTFRNLVFHDNSSWTKSGFRLGVMIVSDEEEGYFNGERVQEGVSEPFRVRDRRTEASEKPKKLKLTHGVKCIKHVGKDRASLLQKKDINTVEDFFKFYYNDEPALREILCIKSESGKEWVSMVEHVMQCADEFHAKYNASNNSSQPRQALVQPMRRNMSLYANGGLRVVGSGSSEPNPYANKITEGDIPICGSSSMIVSNERISTASVEHIVETKPAPFLETNPINVERRNILNGNSVQHTNVGDAESSPNYNTRVPSGGGSYGYGHGQFSRSFTRRDTAAWWDRSEGPLPTSCQTRSVMFAFYYNSG